MLRVIVISDEVLLIVDHEILFPRVIGCSLSTTRIWNGRSAGWPKYAPPTTSR
jgi:hypothetical protein